VKDMKNKVGMMMAVMMGKKPTKASVKKTASRTIGKSYAKGKKM
jgi:hypothetical protein